MHLMLTAAVQPPIPPITLHSYTLPSQTSFNQFYYTPTIRHQYYSFTIIYHRFFSITIKLLTLLHHQILPQYHLQHCCLTTPTLFHRNPIDTIPSQQSTTILLYNNHAPQNHNILTDATPSQHHQAFYHIILSSTALPHCNNPPKHGHQYYYYSSQHQQCNAVTTNPVAISICHNNI